MGHTVSVVPRFFALGLLVAVLPLSGASISGSGGLSVTVSANGLYIITVPAPTWTFSGTVGSAVSHLTTSSGSDFAGGAYSEISFDFYSSALRHGAIRAYAGSRSLLFTLQSPSGGPNTVSFPSLATYPAQLNTIAFAGVFGFPTFKGSNDESPWIGFDSNFHTVILSPATHFMVASTGVSNGHLSSGISSKIAALPAGFTQQVLLVVEDGINRGFDRWGNLLTGLTGKLRPSNDADLTLSRLGYWTDAGAAYYYTMAKGLSYPDTMAAVKADFAGQGISLGYLQLDSWFYPKGAASDWKVMDGGMFEYRGALPPFNGSLANFQHSMALPLVTHARWIDAASPYRQQFRMSGNVSIDPLYWAQMANDLANWHSVTFEQDWLFDRATTDYNLTDADAFLDNMANAMAAQNITVQYCSGTARHFLQASKYSNVTTIRTSMDRFGRTRWYPFLYASRLASAVGSWPFTDVLMSGETDNLLIATLSAGPVGVGDPIGALKADNLRRVVRGDGVIVKPDVPLAPLDRSFWSHSNDPQAPMVSATYTDFGDLRTWYLFEFAQGPTTQVSFRLSEAGVDRPVYLYDYFQDSGQVMQPDDLFTVDTTGFRYQVAVPVGRSGIAVLGDTGQFVPMGKKRVPAFSDDGTARITVAFAPGETVRTLRGYSPTAVTARATGGVAGRIERDSATGLFSLHVEPGTNGKASIELSPRARR